MRGEAVWQIVQARLVARTVRIPHAGLAAQGVESLVDGSGLQRRPVAVGEKGRFALGRSGERR